MPDIFKGSVLFRAGARGWSENFYLSSASVDAALVSLDSYVTQRKKVLSNLCRVTHIRASKIDPPRDGKVKAFLGDTGRGTISNAGDFGFNEQEVIGSAINVRISSGAGTWRHLMVRGLPTDAVLHINDAEEVNPAWAQLFNTNVRGHLLAQGTPYRLQRLTYPNADTTITAVRMTSNRIAAFTSAAAIPGNVAVGDVLQTRNVEGISNANGLWRVIFLGAANEYFVRRHPQRSYGTLDGQDGLIRKVVYDHSAFDGAEIVGVTTRNTGRPSNLRRGRRSVRRR